jgi:hypothetical protein
VLLPYADFKRSAQVLSHKDVVWQRDVAWNVLTRIISGDTVDSGVAMWKRYGLSLTTHTLILCDEMRARGFNEGLRDIVLARVCDVAGVSVETLEATCHQDVLESDVVQEISGRRMLPFWFGRNEVHLSHQAELLRRNPPWYQQFRWAADKHTELVWPVIAGLEESVSTLTQEESKEIHEEAQEKEGETHMSDTATPDAPADGGAQPSSDTNYTREGVVDALRGAGYNGPTSYTKTKLLEMLEIVKAGGTIEVPKRGRRAKEDSDSQEEAPVG